MNNATVGVSPGETSEPFEVTGEDGLTTRVHSSREAALELAGIDALSWFCLMQPSFDPVRPVSVRCD
ncbi:hypothetical protein [Pseudomonas sp.]|uniref:hypothetical protein n=1 Tax=Pseudomonas sp. TaxID=306 RepID=UPI0028A97545|nr:hypothetical protein [Pseudomonas sp.]